MANSKVVDSQKNDLREGRGQMNKEEKLESVQALIQKGKKKGSITYREIMDALQGVDLSADQIDDIYQQFGRMGRDVVPEAGEVDLEVLKKAKEDEEEMVRLASSSA